MTGAPPNVFISYSHDTVAPQERVLDLADRLRTDGIDAEIDQYNDALPEGGPRWCERESGTARLEEAVAAYREALQELTRERVPLQWATTQNNLGNALGERTGDRAKFVEAREAIQGAFDILMQAGQEQYRDYFEKRLQEIDWQIAELIPLP